MKIEPQFKVTIHSPTINRVIDIAKDSCVLGRGKESQIEINEESISRRHLKITLEDEKIFIEDLGSSNGSWFNTKRLEIGVKTHYTANDVIQVGKLESNIILKIENLCVKHIQKAPIALVTADHNSDNDKTLIGRVIPKDFMKVEVPELLIANGAPAQVSPPVMKPTIGLVTTEATVITTPAPKTTHATEHKIGLENKVKNLLHQESEKLREVAQKQSNEILQKAKDEEKIILLKAHQDAQKIVQQANIESEKAKIEEKSIILKAQQDAQKIVHHSKLESEKLKKDTHEEIASLHERAKHSRIEVEKANQELKEIASQNATSVQAHRAEEELHQNKLKSFKDNVQSIQEKIKIENALLEDLRSQASNLKKNADIKLEEIVMEERRIQARIQTDLVEARTQTARIFAEAESAKVKKEMVDTEISQMKSDKRQVEKDITDLEINFKRHEYDFEKLTKEYNSLLEEKNNAQENLDAVNGKFTERQNALQAEENVLRKKVSELEVVANQIVNKAKEEAVQITHAAHSKSKELDEKNIFDQKQMEAAKTSFYIDLEIEKKSKTLVMASELEAQMGLQLQEFKKLEKDKEELIREIKYLKENAQKKCEQIVADGQVEAKTLKEKLEKEIEHKRTVLALEFETMKTKLAKDSELIKASAQNEIQIYKEKAGAYVAMTKQTADQFAEEEKIKWNKKHTQLQDEIINAGLIAKKHQAALEKTEALKDESFINAKAQAQKIIADAYQEIENIKLEGQQLREKEKNSLFNYKQAEIEKIEDLKKEFEQFKIDNKKQIADHTSLAVQEYLIKEMTRSRSLVLDEKLIGKFAEKAKQLTYDASLGRIHATGKIKAPSFISFRDIQNAFKIIFRYTLYAGVAVLLIYAWSNYSKEIMSFGSMIVKLLKDNGIKLP